MIVTYLDAQIDVVCIHQVGNKIADDVKMRIKQYYEIVKKSEDEEE